MPSNDVLQMTDIRRLSPQTTSSSGYHSDLSSVNQSPQLIHENPIEPMTSSLPTEKKTNNKNFSRLSNFLRKQYEKAKLKLISSKQRPSQPVITCSKSTSTTALSDSLENKTQQLSIHKRSSFIEPVQHTYSFNFIPYHFLFF